MALKKSSDKNINFYRDIIRNALSERKDINHTKYELLLFEMCNNLTKKSKDTFTNIYKKYAYEKLGLILESKKEDLDKVLNDIKNNNIGWDTYNYEEFKNKRDITNIQLTEGMKIEEGELPCKNKNCNSKKCFYYELQTRSSDEQSTKFVVCTKCGTRYRFC